VKFDEMILDELWQLLEGEFKKTTNDFKVCRESIYIILPSTEAIRIFNNFCNCFKLISYLHCYCLKQIRMTTPKKIYW